MQLQKISEFQYSFSFLSTTVNCVKCVLYSFFRKWKWAILWICLL